MTHSHSKTQVAKAVAVARTEVAGSRRQITGAQEKAVTEAALERLGIFRDGQDWTAVERDFAACSQHYGRTQPVPVSTDDLRSTVSHLLYEIACARDLNAVGTDAYRGIAWFGWHYEYRYELRDTMFVTRKLVHDRLLAAGLPLNGVSDQHEAIIRDAIAEMADPCLGSFPTQMQDEKQFGRLRKALGYTQAGLAAVVGISRRTVQDYEGAISPVGLPLYLAMAALQRFGADLAQPLTADNFLARREALGLTQKKLSWKTGISERTIQSYESGETPVPLYLSLTLAAVDEEARTGWQMKLAA